MMRVLGIESSCDETGVGIVAWDPDADDGPLRLLADEVASSVAEHARYGGVVPEVASRAHLEAMVPTMRRALSAAGIEKPDAIAVTIGPGLAGALLDLEKAGVKTDRFAKTIVFCVDQEHADQRGRQHHAARRADLTGDGYMPDQAPPITLDSLLAVRANYEAQLRENELAVVRARMGITAIDALIVYHFPPQLNIVGEEPANAECSPPDAPAETPPTE